MKAARSTGESASPYSVCGRVAMINPYAMSPAKRTCSYVLSSSSERPDGGGAAGEGRGEEVWRNRAGHVGMDADHLRRRGLSRRGVTAAGHQIDDDPTPVAALRDEARVPKAPHELDVRLADMHRIPAGVGRLAGESVPRASTGSPGGTRRTRSRHARWDR